MEDTWYYAPIEERVIYVRGWLNELKLKGYKILGYGATARARVMIYAGQHCFKIQFHQDLV